MHLVHGDSVFHVPPGEAPDYDASNPLLHLLGVVERTQLAAEREHYDAASLQYLVPIAQLELYSPAGAAHAITDPRAQDDKHDFQKQNIRSFLLGDTLVTRGWVSAGEWTGPFLRVSYRGHDTPLHRRGALGERLKLWIRIGARVAILSVPYEPRTQRYDLEIWGYPGASLRAELDTRGQDALDRGVILARPDLVPGARDTHERDRVEGANIRLVSPEHAMHPVLPLHVELAWADEAMTVWDSRDGANHHFEFNMVVRGWDQFLSAGRSANPHGGIGSLEYRNLLSNYFAHAGSGELGRTLPEWSFDAHGRKGPSGRREEFMAVDYMDLHALRGSAGIGVHRHRDNQEIFLCMRGQGLMVVGDWAATPRRDRCFELRTLRAGHLAKLGGGQLHGLMNLADEDMQLFMFGGYD